MPELRENKEELKLNDSIKNKISDINSTTINEQVRDFA